MSESSNKMSMGEFRGHLTYFFEGRETYLKDLKFISMRKRLSGNH